MKTAVLVSLAALGLSACRQQGPVDDEANNFAAGPTDVDVLPPDESVATPADELENGADEIAPNNSAL